MPDVLVTPADCEAEILRLSQLLDKATTEIAKRGQVAAEKRVAFKKAEAVWYLRVEGSIPERKALALVECADVLLESEVADARLQAAIEASRNTRSQLDALRSVSASVRAQV